MKKNACSVRGGEMMYPFIFSGYVIVNTTKAWIIHTIRSSWSSPVLIFCYFMFARIFFMINSSLNLKWSHSPPSTYTILFLIIKWHWGINHEHKPWFANKSNDNDLRYILMSTKVSAYEISIAYCVRVIIVISVVTVILNTYVSVECY